jgi:phospholipid/cholesterol/gamma-HCH transport system substrate-binding protein
MTTTQQQTRRNMRIGALVASSLVILMLFLFFIGSEQRLFSRKNDYRIEFDSVAGLAEGNPVKLSGVTVGSVKEIWLPRDPKQENVKLVISVEKKFSERIRQDSRVRLKKLGLLAGDSYIDVTPGSPEQPALAPGSLIPAQRQTNVDALISSGEDLVDNMVQISYSLKNILSRVDRGEGLLGELTQSPETKQRVTDTLLVTLNKTNSLLKQVESGQGLVGRLVYDEEYGQRLTSSLESSMASLNTIMGDVRGSFENGTGALPALLNDPEGRRKVLALVDNLELTSARLAAFTASMETGEGLVPRLMNDKAYADETLKEFNALVAQLAESARKLSHGEGTAGKLIADPSVYESINDILIGINESRLLRWLVRNRQAKGIETRYNAARSAEPPPVDTIVREPQPAEAAGALSEAAAVVEASPTPSPSPESDPEDRSGGNGETPPR